MSRAGEWHLLGADGDPVPGDPDTIEERGRHYSGIAREISSQVTRLRDLAAEDVILKGEYAEGLRESCEETADDLDRAQGRFETVGSVLSSWGEPVRTAQSETWTALQMAEEAQRTLDTNPEPSPRSPLDEPLTDAQQDARDATTAKRDGATDQLSQARTKYRNAMDAYDTSARSTAKKIRDASDDDMKDSRWDKVKGWVDKHAAFLKLIADIIGWIVTIVAIVALFVTPAGWILLLVAAIAVVGVGIRALLAASGNGSWADFAIDLVGVLTLGTGKIATAIAKVGRAATLRVVAETAGNAARADAIAGALAAFKNASFFNKPAVWLFKSNPAMRWIAGRSAYTSTKLSWLGKELPEIGRLDTVLAGMDDVAGAMRVEIRAITAEFPGLVTKGYDVASNVAVNAGRVGVGFDAMDKVLGDSFSGWNDAIGLDDSHVPDFLEGGKPGWGPYGDLKDQFTYSPGGHLG